MKQSTRLTDDQFLQQFENHRLDPASFNHLGHLRLAWLYLTKYQYAVAVDKICTGIQTYALSLGASDKFNKTITIAILQMIYIRQQQFTYKSWPSFVTNNPDIIEDVLSLLLAHYSKERLCSNLAKATFVKPDIKPIELH
ncbi:MAG: hypothetical protein HRU06_15580 [Oceanospirillaceae bacterium]|nr:hypothetical protein [Oceanospirillaceae bacterium]